MNSNVHLIKQDKGHKTKLYHFFSDDPPIMSILILHGMAEHHKRYLSFARYLSSNNIDVFLYDHRGHGTDTKFSELGFISKEKGYLLLIQDAISILEFINTNKRSSKLLLMGHSMGSLIARNVIQSYDKLDGVILCGSTLPNPIMLKLGLFISSIISLRHGPKHPSHFFHNMIFGNKLYTKLIGRTTFDWLSRNNESVGAYIHDPYCGFICSIKFYNDLLTLTKRASIKKLIRKTRRSLPIYIISGTEDPVGGYGKEIQKLSSLYRKLGFNRVSLKLYDDCRHELLQETNSDAIMKDIYIWTTSL